MEQKCPGVILAQDKNRLYCMNTCPTHGRNLHVWFTVHIVRLDDKHACLIQIIGGRGSMFALRSREKVIPWDEAFYGSLK